MPYASLIGGVLIGASAGLFFLFPGALPKAGEEESPAFIPALSRKREKEVF